MKPLKNIPFNLHYTYRVMESIICTEKKCSKLGLPWAKHIFSQDLITRIHYVEHF